MSKFDKNVLSGFIALAGSMLFAASPANAGADAVVKSSTAAATVVTNPANNQANNAATANPFGPVTKNQALAAPTAVADSTPGTPRIMLTKEAQAKQRLLSQPKPGITAALADTSKLLAYGGGFGGFGDVPNGAPKVYIVVYGSEWGTATTDPSGNMKLSNDPYNAVPYMQNLMKDLGTGGERWSGTMTQYCDGPLVATGATSCPEAAPHVGYPSAGAFAGIWYDNSAASPLNATYADLNAEAVKAARYFGNNDYLSNRNAQYIILSAPGRHPAGFNTPTGNFCAFHYVATLPAGRAGFPIAYTNMPYVSDAGAGCRTNTLNTGTQGILDAFSITLGHEYAETLTDQYASGGWLRPNTTLAESADVCVDTTYYNLIGPRGSYAMQSIWSNDTNRCELTHLIANKYNTVVEQLYVAYLGRPAEPAAIASLAAALQAANAPTTLVAVNTAYDSNPALKSLIDNLANSTESNALYLYYSTGSDAIVKAIYINNFNRTADSGGLAFWTGLINNGSLIRQRAPMAIMASALMGTTDDAVEVNNKTFIATSFSSNVDTKAETDAYVGAKAAAQARDLLKMVYVGSDLNSYQFTINQTLANIVLNH